MSARAWPTGLPLVDKLRSCMLQNVPPQSSGSCSSLPYDAAELIHDLYDTLASVDRIILEQRCERGTPWDLACTTIAEKVREYVAPILAQARGEPA